VSGVFDVLSGPGRAAIPWRDPACDPRRELTLHCYRAPGFAPDRPVVLVQHGMGRNGDEYRDFWIPAADRHRLLIVAATFGKDHWPEAEHYNNGLVLDGRGRPRPREAWAYAIPLRVFQALREAGVTARPRAFLFGHSAGGQFGHRLMSTQPHDLLEAVTIGNPGWYSLPTLDTPFPAGLGGIGLGEFDLERLLAYPMTLLVLLCHLFLGGTAGCRQHGHRGRALTRPTQRRWRMVLIECGAWRSGRIGGAARLKVLG
jgi:pimeloyl-ACP methyl ester carboxylesterase